MLGVGALMATLVEVAPVKTEVVTPCGADDEVTDGARDVVPPKVSAAREVEVGTIGTKELDIIPFARVEVAPLPLITSPTTEERTMSARRTRVPPTITV